MSERDSAGVTEALTGHCPFVVQGPPFTDGDEVELSFKRAEDTTESGAVDCWLPLRVTKPNESRAALLPDERTWGDEVVLVRARLARTGGHPRDSMNQPTGEYDADAFTLSDVRLLERSPSDDHAQPARSEPRESDTS